MRGSLLGKVLALGAVIAALMLALASVTGIVEERQYRMGEAQSSVADGLSGPQTLLGPVARRSCEESWQEVQGEGTDRKTVQHKRSQVLHSLPKTLDIQSNARIAPRFRGIYQVNSFDVGSALTAQWADLEGLRPVAEHAGGQLKCDPVQIFVAVGDARGIRSVSLQANGQALSTLPGSGSSKYARGFHAQLPEQPKVLEQPLQIKMNLELVGTGTLTFVPVGESTQASLASDWPHPSFGGRFLPIKHDTDANGFKAQWTVSALASSARQQVSAGAGLCGFNDGSRDKDCVETFGVNFMDPVNVYSLNDRATKYGMLFIVLTFVGVALVEVLRRLRVHPIQYLLVGAAISMFFLLLVALSEHIAFAWAYAAASAACVLLLSFYGSFVLRGARAGLLFGAAIAALYGTLYVLLQLEQAALVLGSLLLFVVLAAVMVVTRRIDWYELMAQMRGPDRPAARAQVPAE